MARILIIDDDVMLLDLLQLHLSGRGISVEVAESAAVALRSIIDSPPDLILLDLGLPDLDGMEVLSFPRFFVFQPIGIMPPISSHAEH